MHLSRISLSGSIHETTPLCVILEIADAHGIKYNIDDTSKPDFAANLIARIISTDTVTIKATVGPEDWRIIARFINKSSRWPQRKLSQAYVWISRFINIIDPLPLIPSEFKEGLQTPDYPEAINACILYRICVYHRLHLTYTTTVQQMGFAVRMLHESPESLLRRARYFLEHEARQNDLINTLLLAHHEIRDPEENVSGNNTQYNSLPYPGTCHEILTNLTTSLNDPVDLRARIIPSTPGGAIALAALNYGLDISRSSVPIREYKILQISQRDGYQPVDPWMKYWYTKNSALFDLTRTFNPIFPKGYYDKARLNEMVNIEGYTHTESQRDDHYELLQLAYIKETFYQGELPGFITTETPVTLDEVQDIPPGLLLCYGTREGELRPITINELITTFTTNQNFTSPFRHNTVFSGTAINKLRNILQGPCESTSAYQARLRLLELIAEINVTLRNVDEPTRMFAQTYRNHDPDTKMVIRGTLMRLVQIGMYMRGWDGKSNYPIVNAPVTRERDGDVAINVTTSIGRFESECRALGRIGSQIMDLPLVSYKSGEYVVSNSARDGYTIGQRIDIVKQGDTTNNIASCIRMSSNWICASAHKYITALGLPAPFDIFNLTRIS
jgi:hypothetical protein